MLTSNEWQTHDLRGSSASAFIFSLEFIASHHLMHSKQYVNYCLKFLIHAFFPSSSISSPWLARRFSFVRYLFLETPFILRFDVVDVLSVCVWVNVCVNAHWLFLFQLLPDIAVAHFALLLSTKHKHARFPVVLMVLYFQYKFIVQWEEIYIL